MIKFFYIYLFIFENRFFANIKLIKNTKENENIITVEFEKDFDLIEIKERIVFEENFYSQEKKIKNSNLINMKFPGETNNPKYIETKFKGNCNLPLLFSKNHQFTDPVKIINKKKIEINYTDSGFYKLLDFSEMNFNTENNSDFLYMKNNQYIIINDLHEKISFFIICLDFEESLINFNIDIMINKTDDSGLYDYFVDVKKNNLEEKNILFNKDFEKNSLNNVFLPWLGNNIEIKNLSFDDLILDVIFLKDKEKIYLNLKKDQSISEENLIATFLQIKNNSETIKKITLEIFTEREEKEDDSGKIETYKIILIVFGVIFLIVIIIIVFFCIKNSLIKKPPSIKTIPIKGIDYPDEEPSPNPQNFNSLINNKKKIKEETIETSEKEIIKNKEDFENIEIEDIKKPVKSNNMKKTNYTNFDKSSRNYEKDDDEDPRQVLLN